MSSFLIERRKKRSYEGREALQYQLENTYKQGGLEVVVIADRSGKAIAQVGDSVICAELASIAPFYKQNIFPMRLQPLLRGGDIAVHRISFCGQEVFLACLGGGVARDALLSRSLMGVQRILSAN